MGTYWNFRLTMKKMALISKAVIVTQVRATQRMAKYETPEFQANSAITTYGIPRKDVVKQLHCEALGSEN